MTKPCGEPLSLSTLLAYWLGELDSEAERQVEQHFFGCAHCGGNLAEIVALGGAIRTVFQTGLLTTIISAAFLERMKQRGMQVREYPVSPGGRTYCTITAADDAVIARMKAPLANVARLDVLQIDEAGNTHARHIDVPFDARAGEVLVCPAAAALKTMPSFCDTMRLVTIDAAGERVLGDYIFDHQPS
jgi:anti-sigma factor RsiW